MKRILVLAMLVSMVFGAMAAQAATEVKMTGDARIHANWWSKTNYTGWDSTGTTTFDAFTIWERFRLRTDFIANENLKFRLGIRANNSVWGNSSFAVDNSGATTFVDVYQAFLQFKIPGTDAEITAGLQPFTAPHASFFGGSSIVMDTTAAAIILNMPLMQDTVSLLTGFTRMLDRGATDPTTTQIADEFDGYFLALPVTVSGFSATPWALFAVAGNSAAYGNAVGGYGNFTSATLANNLFSSSAMVNGFKNSQNLYWWTGAAFEVTALDPFKFYADVIYGQGNPSDRASNLRGGLFFDVAAEYTGFDMVTPQIAFWYSTGEDSALGNGSERMPQVVSAWGPSTSFLFDTDQSFTGVAMGVNPVGSWGFSASLNKISFMADLSHRLTFAYAHGNNSSRALRLANAALGTGVYYQMGRDLTVDEYVMGINLDNTYNIYENLAFMANFGWSHGSFERNVWGRRFVNAALGGDAFNATFGLQYKF